MLLKNGVPENSDDNEIDDLIGNLFEDDIDTEMDDNSLLRFSFYHKSSKNLLKVIINIYTLLITIVDVIVQFKN